MYVCLVGDSALLGYANHGEVSLAKKMATLDDANRLLEDLRSKSFGAAERDQAEVQAFAEKNGGGPDKLMVTTCVLLARSIPVSVLTDI